MVSFVRDGNVKGSLGIGIPEREHREHILNLMTNLIDNNIFEVLTAMNSNESKFEMWSKYPMNQKMIDRHFDDNEISNYLESTEPVWSNFISCKNAAGDPTTKHRYRFDIKKEYQSLFPNPLH